MTAKRFSGTAVENKSPKVKNDFLRLLVSRNGDVVVVVVGVGCIITDGSPTVAISPKAPELPDMVYPVTAGIDGYPPSPGNSQSVLAVDSLGKLAFFWSAQKLSQ